MMKYNSYKDSGVSWFGTIPETWNLSRLKELTLNVKTGTTPTSSNGDFFSDGTEIWFTPSDLNNNVISDSNRKVTKEAFLQREVAKFPPNSVFLIGIGGTLGKVGISTTKAGCNQQINVIVFDKKQVFPKYGFYLMLVVGDTLIKWSNYTTMPIFTQTNTKQLEFLVPPFEEQTAIAEYLDTKTQAIDKKVSLLEKKIAYYQELRKSLINETVTKGMDKNTELQTNELGFATPKKWLRYRLKDLGALYSGLSGKSGDDFNQDDNPDNKGFIPFTNIANNTYLKRDHLGTVVVYEGEKQNLVRKGDIFFLMSSEGYEDIGKSAALAEDIKATYLNSFCKGYRVNPRKTNPYFLNYLMLSDYYRQLLIVEGKGFTRINLKMEKVNDFLVYIPDTLSAQDEIVKFLDTKLDTIAKIIANIQTQITTLKELRKTLINDVVTGKIKVIQD